MSRAKVIAAGFSWNFSVIAAACDFRDFVIVQFLFLGLEF